MRKGLIVCAALTAAGFLLTATTGGHISPLIFALVLGVVIGNTPLLDHPSLDAGLKFSTRWLLRSGIVLFGFSVTLQQVMALGPGVLLLDLIVIAAVILIGYRIGTRWLGLDQETALLISSGSAICGAAAVLATEATIRARPAATAMAVATVVLFGSLAMFIYPALYPVLGWDPGLYGVYIGATVHEVAQVVAAGNAISPEAMTNAVVVKLVRVMLLVPFLLLIGRFWIMRQQNPAGASTTKLAVPWFAFGFLAMVVLNSLVEIPAPLLTALKTTGQIALAMAMAALGLETRMEKLRALGIRPLVLGSILFALLVTGGLFITPLTAGL